MVNSESGFRSFSHRLGPFMGLIAIFVAGAFLNGQAFVSVYNQLNVLARISIIALPSIGMTMVIISAGIDLSVGSLVSLASVVCAMLLMEREWSRATVILIPIFTIFSLLISYFLLFHLLYRKTKNKVSSNIVSILCSIGIGILVFIWGNSQVATGFSTISVLLFVPVFGLFLGALNGVIIAKAKIQPFIVTLGMMSAAVGLAKFIAGKGGQIHAIYYEAIDFAHKGTAHVAPPNFNILSDKIQVFGVKIIPVAGLFFLVSALIVYFILTRLKFGRYIYAIGGNEETARLSGISVDRVKILVYSISGGLSALAGVLYVSAYTQGKSDAGITWELDAIAAVVIGGTSLMGGKGSVTGTVIGVLIIGYLSNILNLQGVPSEVQDILKGVIIVGAVLLQEGMVVKAYRNLFKKEL